MLEAREQNAEEVKNDQEYSQIGQDLMHIFEPFCPPSKHQWSSCSR